LTTDIIKQGASAYTIKAAMPASWLGQPTSVNITVTRDNGTELLASTAATIYAGDTTAAAITKGTKTCTLTTGTALTDGELIAVGSDAYGWQTRIVDSYASGTKTVTVKERFDESLPSGVTVAGRTMSYELDTSTTAWDFLGDVTVEWAPVGISNEPFTQNWTVLKRASGQAGLESRFAAEFKDFYTHCEQNFDTFRKSAVMLVDQHLRAQNRNLKKMIDSSEYDYIIMTRIALNIALAHGPQFDTRVEKLQTSYDDQIAILISIYQWEDTNQDLVKDEDEVSKGSTIGYARNF
jgi:hypothetical protein